MRARLDDVERGFCCNGCLWVCRLVGEPGETALARELVLRLGVAIFFALNVMVFSLAYYGNLLGEPSSAESAARLMDVQRWAQLVLTLPVLALLGGPTLARLPDVIRGRPAGLDGLVAVGALAAFGLSSWNTLRGVDPVYFDTVTMLLVLVTLGKALEASARAKAVQAWSRLGNEQPQSYAVEREGLELELDAAAMRSGDIVRVPAGQTIPVDGNVVWGRALVGTEWLTGESMPRLRGVGHTVLAGAIPHDGPLTIEATATGEQRRRHRLRELLEEARARRPSAIRLADRLATALLPVTLAVAVVAFFLGLAAGGPVEAGRRVVATLVVACPCALGIAAPLAFWTAWAAPAAQGIWLAGADVVERLSRVRHVAFDKTGTLTTGHPTLLSVKSTGTTRRSKEELLSLAASLEHGLTHPLAEALTAANNGGLITQFDSVRVLPGLGVEGHRGEETYLLGSDRLMRERGVRGFGSQPARGASAPPSPPKEAPPWNIFLAHQGVPLATFRFSEAIRFGSGPARRGLDDMGLGVTLLSGDASDRVRSLARELGISQAFGDLLPQDKLQWVLQANRHGDVAVAGDGLNDAPALGAASVGIALGEAADLTRAASHVAAPGASPAAVPVLIRHARRARRIVVQNFAWAATYNAAGLALAAAGMLHPIVAAASMLGSSLLVVTNSLRLRRFPSIPRPAQSQPDPQQGDAQDGSSSTELARA